MRKGRRECASILIWSFSIIVLFTSLGSSEELVLPNEVFFYRPVASVHGQSAVWINPAALSSRYQGSMLLFTQRDERVVRDWGTSVTMKMLAAAYRKIDNKNSSNLEEYIFAISGGRHLKFGLSYRYIKNGPGYFDNRHLWNLGVLSQQSRNLSLGARIENLNRGKIDGKRTDIRFVYGAATRVYRDLVTVSFDVDMTSKENLNQADFRTGIEVRPIPGLYLYADFDNRSRFNLGFRANLGSSYAGHYHNFDRDARSYRGTTYVGSVEGRQPSLIKVSPKSLTVRLDGSLPENPKMPVFSRKPLKYFDYIDGIYRAADDDEIDRLFLNIGTLKCGIGKVEELSNAVKYFGSRGKKVYAFINNPNNLGYLLASAADTLIIPPVSQLNLTGLHANLITIKGLLDKVGIEAEIERVDEYKTAPEAIMFDRPTETNRAQINRILDNLYTEMVNVIAANRDMTPDSVRRLIDLAPLASVDAVEFGLVDKTSYLDDALEDYAASGWSFFSRQMSLSAYLNRNDCYDQWGEPQRLALVIADGSISSGKSGGRMGEYEMLNAIRKVRKDGRVKGVILRVNSPGGSALASDLIWHEIEKTVKEKPVVISMGNVAASGGYYISSIDGQIFVNRNTLTGSIGVFGGKANISELLDKIGVYTESFSRGRNAGLYSMYEPFTDDQRQQLKESMRRFYTHFTELVGNARAITPDSVNALGRGQVWTGTEAVANGLADQIGGVYQALETLCMISGVNRDEVDILSYPQKRYYLQNPFDFPLVFEKLTSWLSDHDDGLAAISLLESDHIFYCMPYNIEIE